MAAWVPSTREEVERRLQQYADMHAGNDKQPEPARQPTEQIDWEKHRQFMRGLG